jgi:F0F1-type ATP synthase alpha subunit
MAVLLAVTKGVFDETELNQLARAETAVRRTLRGKLSEIAEKIERAEKLTDEDAERMLTEARRAADDLREG